MENNDTSKKFISIMFDILVEKGVTDIVCSPGSRNVPLLLAASARPQLKKHFSVDERSAAFMGLGISLVSQKPVAFVCTSGTALLNYAPAVAEAYYQSIPLIIISADRPLQWIDQDDSQTLRQSGALDNYVKKSYTIPAVGEEDQEMLWYVNRIANDALTTALTGRKGPVHINIHLAEPLGHKVRNDRSETRIIGTLEADSLANKEIFKLLATHIASSKTLLVAGFMPPNSSLQKVLSRFCKFPNVAVMAETISNLHLRKEDYMVDSVLTAYDNNQLDSLAPDIVISLGGALVSRKLKEYLRRHKDYCRHWSVGYSHTTADPFMSLSLRIESDPVRFFRNLNGALTKTSCQDRTKDYQSNWHDLRKKASELKNRYIQNSDWSELKAFHILLNHIPSFYNLFLSNGTAIRYAQIIEYRLPHASYCNRGVSGIDGSTSTAIGGAMAYKGKSLLITGDLSFSYDIGALGLQNIPEDFKIIVMDNQGGGIFRFIPSTGNLEEREEYLCLPPNIPYRQLAQGYGWKYFECSDEKTLKENLPKFFESTSKSMLIITCPGKESATILRDYMQVSCADYSR